MGNNMAIEGTDAQKIWLLQYVHDSERYGGGMQRYREGGRGPISVKLRVLQRKTGKPARACRSVGRIEHEIDSHTQRT
jgi:hypothetical protein